MNRLRQAREQLGLSREKAARFAGISTSMWIKIERGERTPTLGVAQRIAKVLGRTLDDLFMPSNNTECVNHSASKRNSA